MLKLGRVTKDKVLYLVLVFVFNFDLFKFSAAILEKGLLLTLHHNTCRAFPCDSQSSKVETALDWLTWDTGYLLKCIKKKLKVS